MHATVAREINSGRISLTSSHHVWVSSPLGWAINTGGLYFITCATQVRWVSLLLGWAIDNSWLYYIICATQVRQVSSLCGWAINTG